MKRTILLAVTLFIFLFNPNSYAQIIGFYPPGDTLLAGGGCTPPEIICRELSSTMLQDSIAIDPGWNTWMFIRDSFGNRIDFDNSYFLIDDSSDQYEYEIWLHSQFDPSTLIPFDSTFLCDFWKFDIQLIVKEQGIPIDSLSQPFKAEYGLGVEDEVDNLLVSQQVKLFQNYPNPFNPVTSISFFLPKASPVKIEVFNVMGKKMTTIINSKKNMGSHTVEFDASELGSGVYFYRIQTNQFMDVKKMILIK